MFCFLILLIFAIFSHTGIVRSFDDLEFWTGDPELNARRTQWRYNRPTKPNIDKDIDFRYSMVKSKMIQNKNKPNKTAVVTKYKDIIRKDLKPTIRYKVDRHRDGVSTDPVDRAHRSWPKVKAIARHKRIDNIPRVTRMTPVYLMQNEKPKESGESTKGPGPSPPKKEPEAVEEVDHEISSYSIKKDMMELADMFPGANVSIEIIGRTAEYNDIIMLKIAEKKSEISRYFRADESKYIDEVPEKRIVLIVHGLSVMGLRLLPCMDKMSKIKELVSYYIAHLDKFDIFWVPVGNPDGFVRRDNLWNKNMSPQGACAGVALDRNFDVMWNHSQTVSSCSQHYPGPAPFSEPETRAIREVLHHYSHKVVAYFHVRSGTSSYENFKGDAVLYPKGYTDVQSDDDKYIDLRAEIDEAMKNASFQVISVTVDTLHSWYGKVVGSSVDYASTVYGVPYALELVMQPYEDLHLVDHVDYATNALREIWKRVIDVIFNNIWRNTKNNDI